MIYDVYPDGHWVGRHSWDGQTTVHYHDPAGTRTAVLTEDVSPGYFFWLTHEQFALLLAGTAFATSECTDWPTGPPD